MEKKVQKFSSFDEAEKAEREYYRSLTPQQRIEILLELIARYRRNDESAERLERVYRIIKLV
jgi:hypothetical protein